MHHSFILALFSPPESGKLVQLSRASHGLKRRYRHLFRLAEGVRSDVLASQVRHGQASGLATIGPQGRKHYGVRGDLSVGGLAWRMLVKGALVGYFPFTR